MPVPGGTVTVVEALTTVCPAAVAVRFTLHEPVPPPVWQDVALRVAVPDTLLNVMVVPSGAFTKLVPLEIFTWPVRTWVAPTAFTAAAGVIWMLASTTVACSEVSPQLPATPAL